MQILLRRASSLAKACGREAQVLTQKFEQDSDIKLSVHMYSDEESIAQRLRAESEKVMQNLWDALDLYRAQSVIRTLIGRANAETVSPLLTERDIALKPAERTLASYLTYAELGGRDNSEHNAAEIHARLTGLRARLQTVTSGSVADTIRTSKLSAADLDAIRNRQATIQRRLLDIGEEMAKANLGQMINLPDDVVAILRKHKIIA